MLFRPKCGSMQVSLYVNQYYNGMQWRYSGRNVNRTSQVSPRVIWECKVNGCRVQNTTTSAHCQWSSLSHVYRSSSHQVASLLINTECQLNVGPPIGLLTSPKIFSASHLERTPNCSQRDKCRHAGDVAYYIINEGRPVFEQVF
jgi:hypothetical protein